VQILMSIFTVLEFFKFCQELFHVIFNIVLVN
jgi:hypothetical protein